MKPPPPISQQSGTIRYQDLITDQENESGEIEPDEPQTPTVLESPPAGQLGDFESPVTADLAASQQIAYWRIPPYRIDRLIGSGGLADVYLAYDENLRCEVAIKCLRIDPDCERNTLDRSSLRLQESLRDETKRFLREWQALGALDHPNIVRARFAGESQGIPFLVMDYVKGGDLQSYLRTTGRPDFRQTVQWMIEACRGLEHAHNLGIVHRDLKPSNLLLDEYVEVKLTDFGISHIEVPDEQSVTIPGVMMGTPDYVAPEQIMCFAAADHRADIYSLGCTFFFVLFGYAPFEHRVTLKEKLAAHRNEQPTYDWHRTLLAPAQQSRFQSLLERMLQKDPDHRPQATSVILRELQDMLTSDPAQPSPRIRSPQRSSGVWIGPVSSAVALSLLCALAIAFVQWMQGDETPSQTISDSTQSTSTQSQESNERNAAIDDEAGSTNAGDAESTEQTSNDQVDVPTHSDQPGQGDGYSENEARATHSSRDQSNGIALQVASSTGRSKFAAQETIQLELTSEQDGCFFLFRQDPFGRIELIFPNQFDGANHLTKGVPSTLPQASATWTLSAHPEPGAQLIFCIAFGNETQEQIQAELPEAMRSILPPVSPDQWTHTDVRNLMDAMRLKHRRYKPEQLYEALIASQAIHARAHAIAFVPIETISD